MTKDLTQGKPFSVLWRFCLPLFASVIFQQLYNIADSLVAGKFIGENALAAVGNSYEITLIFIAFAFGCNIGCSVVTSQLFGAKQFKDMKTAVTTSFIASGVVCVVLMVGGIAFGSSLLKLINTPAEIFDQSLIYLDIYVYGLPFMFFYNIATGIFSALGDSKTPFVFLAVSSTANILVDIIFVAVLDMGVAGVGWATFLCQGISCILSVAVVFKRLKGIQTDGKAKLFSSVLLKRFLKIAIPSVLQQSFISIGNIIIQGEINSYGAGVIAGYSAAVKLNNFVITAFTTLGNGISNFTAQNVGAKKYGRIKQGLGAGIKMVAMLSCVVVALYMIFAQNLVGIFMDNPSRSALDTGVQFLRILAPFYFVISIKLVSDGVLRGAGLMKQFMVATFSDLILRVVLAMVLSGIFGVVGIWCAWPVGWCIGTLLSTMFYKKAKFKG